MWPSQHGFAAANIGGNAGLLPSRLSYGAIVFTSNCDAVLFYRLLACYSFVQRNQTRPDPASTKQLVYNASRKSAESLQPFTVVSLAVRDCPAYAAAGWKVTAG